MSVLVGDRAPSAEQAAEFRRVFGAGKLHGGVILYGDSRVQLENSSGASATNGAYNNARGAFSIARAMHGSSIEVVVNAGVGGNTYADLLARFDTDVLPSIPDASVVYLMCGINDILADKTASQIIADATAVHKRFLDSGLKIIEFTDYAPAVGKELTTARELVMMELNRWKKSLAGSGRIFVVDSFAAMSNTAAIPPNSPTSRILDPTGSGIHMNPGGAFLIAKKLLPILDVLYPRSDVLVSSAADTYGRNPLSTNLIDNPLFVGTGGTNGTGCSNDPAPAAGFTAGVSALWNAKRNSGAGSALTSFGPAADSVGNVQRMIVSGASSGDAFQLGLIASEPTRVAPLGRYVAKCKVDVKGAVGLHTVYLRIFATCDGVSYQWRDMAESIPATGAMEGDFTLTLKTPIAQLPDFAACTIFNVHVLALFSGAGGATVDVSQISVERR